MNVEVMKERNERDKVDARGSEEGVNHLSLNGIVT